MTDPSADVKVRFEQSEARGRVEAEPLSHVSIDLGRPARAHGPIGPDALRRHLTQAVPWVSAARQGSRVRVSTCYLVDDYLKDVPSPLDYLPALLDAARECGLGLDYVARTSALAHSSGLSPAQLLVGRLVAEPLPGDVGARPPLEVTGWLTNGRRSVDLPPGETAGRGAWNPPSQTSAVDHSIFADIQLWGDAQDGQRPWSAALLVAVWQALRLGALRDHGRVGLRPQPWDGGWPERWADLPPIVKLTPNAAPFAAYRSLSITNFAGTQTAFAVRTILDQLMVDEEVSGQVLDRAAREGITLSASLIERISYVLL
ncbi:SCO2522 family protein [Longispora urticae]